MKRKVLTGMLLICTAVLFLGAFISTVSASTLYVPDDYATIQAAVNAASPGDTLIVRDGTYTENINVSKRLTIKSENGADKTIVQAAYSCDHVFEVTADFVTISGFTVNGATSFTAGIYIYYADYCIISNNKCTNNDIDGICLEHSNYSSISDNKCTNNDIDGIFLWDSNNNSVFNNKCSNNGGDGICLAWDSNNNRISDNICSNDSVGIYLRDSNDNNISNNKCSNNYYGICPAWDSNSNRISDNICSNNHHGIFLEHSNDNRIFDNICSSNNNNGIWLWDSNNNSISNNICSNSNTGISLGDSKDNKISNNDCSSNNNEGICLVWDSNNNRISNNKCSNNNVGIFLYASRNNVIYHNNFISSTDNVYSYNSTNIWNSPSKIRYTYKGKTCENYLGNYWDDYKGSDANGDGTGNVLYHINSDKDYYPLVQPFENYDIYIADSEGRQQLVETIEELELAIIDSIDYDVQQVADSYALLATAAELTPWWRELARLALDTIHAVVGTVIEVGDFLTPKGANQVLEDPSTCQQVINGVKDSKDILGGIATFQGLAGLYRNADSYKLSFEAINTVEEVARQEDEVSGDFDRTANAAWLELWRPSTPNGLLIPLKTGAPLKEGSRSSVSRWVNGIKEVREEVKNSFDDVINEIPDPLPADYPLDETITHLNNLKQQIRGGGYRVVKFKCVEDDKEIKRHITLGMVHEGREATSLLYDAWMDDLDVQYTSTLHKTGETIMHVTTYGFPATGVTKKVIKGVSDIYEVIDIIQLPSDLVNLIDKPVHPLDALQNHTVKMNNDLVHETSNLWTLAEGTLKYLQYTWEPESEKKTGVVVTILPQADFVEEIGADNVDVTVMVPPGASPHTYSPTPSQLRAVSRAKIYFKVGSGVEFENAWMDKILGVNPDMLVVGCAQGITKMGKDPHIWNSPVNAKVMVNNICDGLIEIDPEHEAEYTANRDKYLQELDEVDAYIHERLDRFTKNRVFMVYHPAFGYFATQYNLRQIAIEHKGKAPTPKGIQDCIDQARQYNLSYVYVAPQFTTKDAEVIAHEIGGQTVFIDPLPLDYCANMRSIGVLLSLEME